MHELKAENEVSCSELKVLMKNKNPVKSKTLNAHERDMKKNQEEESKVAPLEQQLQNAIIELQEFKLNYNNKSEYTNCIEDKLINVSRKTRKLKKQFKAIESRMDRLYSNSSESDDINESILGLFDRNIT